MKKVLLMFGVLTSVFLFSFTLKPTTKANLTLSPNLGYSEPQEEVTVVVSANEEWVNTGIHVSSGSIVNIKYLRGGWTCDKNKYSYVDANGHTDEAQTGLADFSSLKTVHNQVFGRLLAGISGTSKIYTIGNHREVYLHDSGILMLKINDEGLGDNAGAITVHISKGQMEQMPQGTDNVKHFETPKVIRRLDPTNPKNWSFKW